MRISGHAARSCPEICYIYKVMKNPYVYAAVCLLAVAGCSTDNGPEVPSGGTLDFDVQSEKAGEPVTTESIQDFRVTAYKRDQWSSKFLMQNVAVTRVGLNKWVYSPPVEWPGDTTVDFYAVSPAWVEMDNNPWTQTDIVDWDGENNISTDLLIGVRTDVKQSDGRLKLNFRHALARISVRLKCTIDNAVARIKEVRMCNFADNARFSFPRTTTTQDTDRGELFDNWQIYNTTSTTVTLFRAADGYIAVGPESVALCENAYFIPVELRPVDTVPVWEASFMEIVYQIADSNTGDVLWPEEGLFRTVLVDIGAATPQTRWLPGKTYVYTVDAFIPETRSADLIGCEVF